VGSAESPARTGLPVELPMAASVVKETPGVNPFYRFCLTFDDEDVIYYKKTSVLFYYEVKKS
jgi:hypothetical protein